MGAILCPTPHQEPVDFTQDALPGPLCPGDSIGRPHDLPPTFRPAPEGVSPVGARVRTSGLAQRVSPEMGRAPTLLSLEPGDRPQLLPLSLHARCCRETNQRPPEGNQPLQNVHRSVSEGCAQVGGCAVRRSALLHALEPSLRGLHGQAPLQGDARRGHQVLQPRRREREGALSFLGSLGTGRQADPREHAPAPGGVWSLASAVSGESHSGHPTWGSIPRLPLSTRLSG
mmetsp:Transcript_31905/g.75801  ORF Transcript_31905/g.75801 Transcript_31905/m.75801 type:complete len:229 (-) Transcript_31905:49-735(-)